MTIFSTLTSSVLFNKHENYAFNHHKCLVRFTVVEYICDVLLCERIIERIIDKETFERNSVHTTRFYGFDYNNNTLVLNMIWACLTTVKI